MGTTRALAATLLLLGGLALVGPRDVAADGSTVGRSTDAVAKELADEFEELVKSKKPKLKDSERQLEILRTLERAPCDTAVRFLVGLVKKKSTTGDHRLYAMRALLKMADDKALDTLVSALQKGKDATLWFAFGEMLAQDPSDEVRAWFTGKGLKAKDAEVCGACLDALAAAPVEAATEAVREIYEREAASTSGGELAYRALRALVRCPGADARALLLEAARNEQWQVRLAAAERLAALEPFDAEPEAAVRGLLQDENAWVKEATAHAAATAKRKVVAHALIGLLADPRLRTRHVAASALAAISGKALGHDPATWNAWLAEQDPGTPPATTVPSYHGVDVHTDRVLFLVDASSSMTWPWRKEPHRIDVARDELVRVLEALQPGTAFNVVVYAEKPLAWKKELAEASPGAVKAAASWAERAMSEPEGDTFLFEALEWAFESDPSFDTIFLLTDGNPTAGRYWTVDGLVASVRAWTRFRRVAVHTIGLSLLSLDRGMPNLSETPALMTQLLKEIAAATQGEFREYLNVPSAK